MSWESDHVESARARGVSWFHCAQQVGKCEWDIRRRYDPALKVVALLDDEPSVSQPPKAAVKDRHKSGVYVRRVQHCSTVVVPGTRVAQVLELAADGVEMTRVWIAEKIGVSPHAASDSITNLYKRDLLERTRTGWLITDYGLEVVELLREARG